jgi:hypothetical protein
VVSDVLHVVSDVFHVVSNVFHVLGDVIHVVNDNGLCYQGLIPTPFALHCSVSPPFLTPVHSFLCPY